MIQNPNIIPRTNKDLDPVPGHLRKWGLTSFISYWISDAFNAATWQFASSIIAIGLTWRESLGIVALAFFIISFVIALNGAIGVIHHVPFPVLARASWGFWGSYVAIVSRAILAVFWYAIQNMNGANAVRVMIGSVWPSFLTMRNGISEDQGIETVNHPLENNHPITADSVLEHHDIFLPFLARECAVSVHASQQSALAVHGEKRHCARCLDCDSHLGICEYRRWRDVESESYY